MLLFANNKIQYFQNDRDELMLSWYISKYLPVWSKVKTNFGTLKLLKFKVFPGKVLSLIRQWFLLLFFFSQHFHTQVTSGQLMQSSEYTLPIPLQWSRTGLSVIRRIVCVRYTKLIPMATYLSQLFCISLEQPKEAEIHIWLNLVYSCFVLPVQHKTAVVNWWIIIWNIGNISKLIK